MGSPHSSTLSQDQILVAAGNITLQFREGMPWVGSGGTLVDVGPQVLAVLDLFRQPLSVADAMRRFTAERKDPRLWMQVSGTIFRLYQAGILHEPGSEPPKTVAKPLAQSGVQFQAWMLNDKARTQAFLRAIRETVQPGDVVLDLGTGTGILGITAARAGAQVYSMEMTGMADAAERMFAGNGLTERITLMRGVSTGLELPRPADVLVTEIIGDGPLDERVLECILDARKRLLQPDARIIPAKLTIYVVALRLPDDLLDQYTFSPGNIARWSQTYDVDYSPVASCDPTDLLGIRITTKDFLRCQPVSELVPVVEIDFKTFTELTVQEAVRVPMTAEGPLHGFAMCFDLEVSARERLSTVYPGLGPLAVDPENAWRIPLWLCLQPYPAALGERPLVTVQYSDGATRLSWAPAR